MKVIAIRGFSCRDDADDHIDVCMSCGRYYGMSQRMLDHWRSLPQSKTQVMPQLCSRCFIREYGDYE